MNTQNNRQLSTIVGNFIKPLRTATAAVYTMICIARWAVSQNSPRTASGRHKLRRARASFRIKIEQAHARDRRRARARLLRELAGR